jgi:hypothetical protein
MMHKPIQPRNRALEYRQSSSSSSWLIARLISAIAAQVPYPYQLALHNGQPRRQAKNSTTATRPMSDTPAMIVIAWDG